MADFITLYNALIAARHSEETASEADHNNAVNKLHFAEDDITYALKKRTGLTPQQFRDIFS